MTWLYRGNQDAWIPSFGILGREYAYRFAGIADFLLSPDGSVVRVFFAPNADPWSLDFVLLRGVIPRVLHLRGIPCLHASGVRAGGGVVGFMGSSGRGKSTLAAALVARGLPLVTDDVMPLRLDPGRQQILVGPGLHELRLYPPAAALVGVGSLISPPRPGQTKGCWTPHPRQCAPGPAPLTCLYWLHPRRDPARQPLRTGPRLKPMKAFFAMVENSFWLHPQETKALASDMACFAPLARQVPVRRLYFEISAQGFDALQRLLIRKHVR